MSQPSPIPDPIPPPGDPILPGRDPDDPVPMQEPGPDLPKPIEPSDPPLRV